MDNENINYSDYKYDFESKIVMNEQDYFCLLYTSDAADD